MLKRSLSILALLVAGCAAYVPLGYQGEGSTTLAKIDAPELIIYLEHIGSKYQHSIFDLEVINRNPAPIYVGLAVYDDVKDAEDRKKKSYTEKDARQAATRNALVTAGFIASDLAEAVNQKAQEESYYLPYEIFSEGKIDSLSRKRGKIFLPQGEDLRYLRIVLPIENKEYIFDFKRKGAK
jgi:hypothetical protein